MQGITVKQLEAIAHHVANDTVLSVDTEHDVDGNIIYCTVNTANNGPWSYDAEGVDHYVWSR